MSREAVVGTGITIWALGVLFLLLGWAQHLRGAEESIAIFLIIGAVLFAGGLLVWLSGGKRAAR